jgi:three-Cys-motif partner protein
MPDRLPTIWDIDPHTKAKHFILRGYLGGWFPILSSWAGRIVYIDGFAGPGRYKGGEEGSPVIAIRTAADHVLKLSKEIVFLFIEARPDRKAHLVQVLKETFTSLPANMKYSVSEALFADKVTSVLDGLDAKGATLAPTFAFLDPFGFKGMPMAVVARILNYKRSEALITFMEGFINRFSESGMHEEGLDEVFGTPAWRGVHKLTEPEGRRRFLLDLYTGELKSRVPELYTRTFEMADVSNNVLYVLVFATHSVKGMEVMKEAMWAADKTGSYRFSDRTDPLQTTLFLDNPTWRQPASKAVYARFAHLTVPVEQVWKFVVTETGYRFRRSILKRLEEEGKILDVGPRKKAGTFPDGCSVQFA